MPKRRKQLRWSAPDLVAVKALFEGVDDLYPNGLSAIAAIAIPPSPEATERLNKSLREAIGFLRLNLYFEERPATLQVRIAVDKLLVTLTRAHEQIAALEDDARQALSDAAGVDPGDPQREPNFEIFGANLGKVRFEAAVAELEHLERWASRCKEGLKRSKPGRKVRDSVRQATEQLCCAWTEIHGKKEPTLASSGGRTTGAFLDFVRAAVSPALREHGIEMDLESAVRKVLYG